MSLRSLDLRRGHFTIKDGKPASAIALTKAGTKVCVHQRHQGLALFEDDLRLIHALDLAQRGLDSR